MKKILIGVIAFALFGGSAYAASVNGLYKGRDIVRIMVNGKPVQSSVPGQLIDGSTMLPLRAVAEALGASVTWDGKKAQASITTQQTPTQPVETGLTLEQLNRIGESVGMVTALDSAGNPVRSGSGFILDGRLITNHHVVVGSSSLKITFGTKETTIKSEYLFDNADKDLAAVKFEGYPSLKLNVTEPSKNDHVYSLGFPDKRFTITEGTVMFYSLSGRFVHDAMTDHGSSGGIAIDSNGQVIGISAGGLDGTEYNDAIPSKYLQEELNKIK